MFWYLLIGYVVLAEVTVLGVVYFAASSKGCDNFEALRESVQNWKARTILAVGILLTAPLLFPGVVYVLIRVWPEVSKQCDEELEYWQNVRHEFKSLSLERLHEANVDEELRAHFDLQSEFLEVLDYQHLGEVWLKDSQPQMSKGSFWLSPSGEYLAEASQTLGHSGCEIASFLDDGTVVSTADCEANFEFSAMERLGYFVSCQPGLEMDQLIAAHELKVQQVSESKRQSVRQISNENWKDYLRYTSRRFAEVMNKIDGKTEVPDAIVFPENELAGSSTAASVFENSSC